MSRNYVILTATVLAVGFVSMRNLTRASDDDRPSVALEVRDESSQVAKLIERIDQLEKRLAALEGREPLIRQADTRQYVPVEEGTAPNWYAVPQKDARPRSQLPPLPPDDSNETNGQKWKFHLLNNRQTSPCQTFENPGQDSKLTVPRNIQKPTT